MKNMSDSDDENDTIVDLNNLPQEIFLKILILGDLGVGKSSLVKQFCYSDAAPGIIDFTPRQYISLKNHSRNYCFVVISKKKS